ncbi:MAG: hypothetical protein SNH13_02465 [Rikenellaceae bacterium]
MTPNKAPKRRLVTSYNNLPADLQAALKEKYPLGFSDEMMRIDKPNGDFFYAVSLSTEEADYLVKIDVKIDAKIDGKGDDDKDLFGDEMKDGDESLGDADDEDDDRSQFNDDDF